MAQSPTQRELSEKANDRIRDAAKWLVASFAGVGAALIAGSQLSSIGRLDFCIGASLKCTRLYWALAGAVIAVLGVVWAIWVGVGLLVPQTMAVSELQEAWRSNKFGVRKYFSANRNLLQGFRDFHDLDAAEKKAYAAFDEAAARYEDAGEGEKDQAKQDVDVAESDLNDVLARSEAVVSLANQIAFSTYFRGSALRRMLVAAFVAAVGIGIFAWAGNPPSAPLSSASLQGASLIGDNLTGAKLEGADLSDANLAGANLTGTDLKGADLTGARLGGITWSHTTCPDGTISDDVGGTCLNHLDV